MADYMQDPTEKVWVLVTYREVLNETGQIEWSKPGFRGPYFSLKAAQRQVKNQAHHPQYYINQRNAGHFVGNVRVEIVEMVGVLSVVDAVEWTP